MEPFGLHPLLLALHHRTGRKDRPGRGSRYAYEVEGLHELLLEQFGDEYLEEQDEVEFLISEEEPRTPAEIIEAEQEFFDKVWYVRSIAYEDDKRELPGDIRAGMTTARERVEAEYRRHELWEAIGPGHEEAWQYGYISGKLATLRWVLAASRTSWIPELTGLPAFVSAQEAGRL